MAEPFYITTAISYPNGRPHIGHAYEAVAADAIARFHRLMGHDVCLLTGTDEHGLKMMQTARAQGRETIELADEMSGYFTDMCRGLNISYDHFCRTSAPQHHAASQALWERMAAKGDLYLDRYEGWYSVRDEAFYDESELTQGEGGVKLSPQGTPVEWTAEETWFFRLSRYQQPLLDLFAAQPDFIRPASRRNEVQRFVEGGLRDLSVSRTSLDWGVKVPGSDGHVMYVWVDALTTYISGLGFPDEVGEFARYWPADIHLIGKDIVRFHTVYWPAFLMSAGLPLPQQVFGHGFILARDGQKMSKSAGNSADPMVLAERYGVDQLRYFFLREVAFGQDGSWSEEAIVTRCNAELANSFGNLAQRVLSFVAKNCPDGLPFGGSAARADGELQALVTQACRIEFPREFAALNLSGAIEAWMRAVYACNHYIDEQAPWTLRKTDPERMTAVLATLIICIRDLAITIQPVVPTAASQLLDQLGIPGNERDYAALADSEWYARRVAAGPLATPSGIFPRLELPAEV
jgi:methionyl-tRNA synthetase